MQIKIGSVLRPPFPTECQPEFFPLNHHWLHKPRPYIQPRELFHPLIQPQNQGKNNQLMLVAKKIVLVAAQKEVNAANDADGAIAKQA